MIAVDLTGTDAGSAAEREEAWRRVALMLADELVQARTKLVDQAQERADQARAAYEQLLKERE
ncbi:hypothetical protein [Gordonia sp. MMO-8]|uniref:hypothetical protein n=1 Tax=Gordonia sp. MMO-8 TaxID=3127886 RepID=UPI00301893AF